jgi:hypothetical protein
MGNVKRTEKELDMKLIDTIISRLTEEDIEQITECIAQVSPESGRKEVDSKPLRTLFDYWHKYIPNHKQSITCGGCRMAVVRFWTQVTQKIWQKDKIK